MLGFGQKAPTTWIHFLTHLTFWIFKSYQSGQKKVILKYHIGAQCAPPPELKYILYKIMLMELENKENYIIFELFGLHSKYSFTLTKFIFNLLTLSLFLVLCNCKFKVREEMRILMQRERGYVIILTLRYWNKKWCAIN